MNRALSILVVLAVAGALVALMLLTLSGGPGPLPPAPPPPADDGGGSTGDRPLPPGAGGAYDPLLPGPGGPSPGGGAGSIAGTVREAGTGQRVADAEVMAWEGRWRSTARTDATGAYRIDDVPAGSVRVKATSALLADSDLRGVPVAAGETSRADFDLPAGVVVEGRVTDSETGDGIGGARVFLFGSDSKQVESGPDGRYRLPGVPAAGGMIGGSAPDYPEVRAAVKVAEGETRVEQDLVLERGATVNGVVLDTQGRPVAGAAVSLRGFPPSSTKSEADGSFTLRGVATGRTVFVAADREGYVSARSGELRLRPGETMTSLRLALSRGGTVRGTVLFSDGRPAAGATVWLVPRDPAGMAAAPPRATTDDAGSFVLTPVAAGDHQLVANHTGGLETRQDVTGVTEGGTVADVVVRLGLGRSVSGTVADASGRPLSGMVVMARPVDPQPGARWGNARSDAEGKFEISGLAPGTYEVTVRPPRGGVAARTESVPAGTADLRLVLPSPGSISGTVVDASGAPVTSFTLQARSDDPQAGGMVFERVNAADGRFRATNVSPGTYTLTVSGSNGFSEPMPGIVVAEGAEVSGLRIVLQAPGRIRGRVTSDDGRPVAGARVSVTGDRPGLGNSGSSARTDESGNYRLEGLRPGAYRVVVASGGLVAAREEVLVTSGGEVAADLSLPAQGRLVVRVAEQGGGPVAGASVILRTAEGAWIPVTPPTLADDVPPDERAARTRDAQRSANQTDESGICVRDGVPAGEILVRVSMKGYASGEARVSVPPGRSAEAAITLVPGDDGGNGGAFPMPRRPR